MTESQEKTVEALQKEMHQYAEIAMKNGKTEYQDVVTIYLLWKLAEFKEQIFFLEEKIETLEGELSDIQSGDEDFEKLVDEDYEEDFDEENEEKVGGA